MSLGQQVTPTALQVSYEVNIYFCFVQTPLYKVLKIAKYSETICDTKNDCRGNRFVFCPGYDWIVQARNRALELLLLGHSKAFLVLKALQFSLWT